MRSNLSHFIIILYDSIWFPFLKSNFHFSLYSINIVKMFCFLFNLYNVHVSQKNGGNKVLWVINYIHVFCKGKTVMQAVIQHRLNQQQIIFLTVLLQCCVTVKQKTRQCIFQITCQPNCSHLMFTSMGQIMELWLIPGKTCLSGVVYPHLHNLVYILVFWGSPCKVTCPLRSNFIQQRWFP